MNIKQLIALGALATVFSSCGLLGNAVSGGPAFSGTVATTVTNPPAGAPAASSYKLALVRFTDFGNAGSDTIQAAAFSTTIQINGGTGVFSGFLTPTIDLGNSDQRFYKVAIYDDKDKNDIYNTTATGPSGEKDVLLADSANSKTASGNRFFLYAKVDGTWSTGADKDIKAGWNLVTDPSKDSSVTVDALRSDDKVTQAGGFGGIDITYP